VPQRSPTALLPSPSCTGLCSDGANEKPIARYLARSDADYGLLSRFTFRVGAGKHYKQQGKKFDEALASAGFIWRKQECDCCGGYGMSFGIGGVISSCAIGEGFASTPAPVGDVPQSVI
jgi:hypothetical protein